MWSSLNYMAKMTLFTSLCRASTLFLYVWDVVLNRTDIILYLSVSLSILSFVVVCTY
ncbi:hypothetical protein BDQ17DRAFT_1352794 [Cyathus striatus]|nr:hypothetical protein BDQ17DRAFT_1352794 [Cyathus striatus]